MRSSRGKCVRKSKNDQGQSNEEEEEREIISNLKMRDDNPKRGGGGGVDAAIEGENQ